MDAGLCDAGYSVETVRSQEWGLLFGSFPDRNSTCMIGLILTLLGSSYIMMYDATRVSVLIERIT